ncbi:MAG: hypothetical protein K6B72_03460, partial [Lachnospiraceae bacterium]|nr:hypothetical protein [Lachnospiraceae bacterium]
MRKKIIAMLMAGVLGASMLSGCGNEDKSAEKTKTEEKEDKEEKEEPEEKEAQEEPAEEEFDVVETIAGNTDIPAPVEIDMNDYYSIVTSYPDDYYFGFADIDPLADALLITSPDFVFDAGDGVTAATQAQIYGFDEIGNIKDYGCVVAGGTATPLATKDSQLYYGGHNDMNRLYIDEPTSSLVEDKGAYFDEYEEATVVGFMTVAEGKDMFQEYDDFDGPSDFIQYQAGQNSFKDFKEILSFLTPGQGYAYVKVKGVDGDILALAETVDPKDKSSMSVTLYRESDNGAIQLGILPG